MVLLLTPALALAAAQTTFYVAPDGSDANPGTEAKPFATLEKARQAVRAINKDMTGDIVVVLRGGTYRIDKTITFEADDSGTNGHNVIYRAQAGETPIISGGKPVVGWQPDEKGRWKAPAPVDDFRQLYVGGVRAIARPRRHARRTRTRRATTATRPRRSRWPSGRIPAIWSSAT